MGYVEQDPQTTRYRLGPMALRLGFAAMTTVDAIRVARPIMHEICQKLNHTIVLAVWNNGAPTIALKEAAPGPIVIVATEGSTMTLLRSAIGRAFGAWLPQAKTERLLTEELAQLRADPQPGMPRNIREANELFQEIRKRGLSRLTGQLSPTLHSLAAPVFDSNGTISAVLCTVGPAREFDSTWSGSTANELRAAAATLSRGLGYSGAS
jgi:DNA-binding IclR family transcriptional regulator